MPASIAAAAEHPAGVLAVLKAHRREILDPAIASHHGRIVVALQA